MVIARNLHGQFYYNYFLKNKIVCKQITIYILHIFLIKTEDILFSYSWHTYFRLLFDILVLD